MRMLGHLLRNRRAGEQTLAWNADGLDRPGDDRSDESGLRRRRSDAATDRGQPVGDERLTRAGLVGRPGRKRDSSSSSSKTATCRSPARSSTRWHGSTPRSRRVAEGELDEPVPLTRRARRVPAQGLPRAAPHPGPRPAHLRVPAVRAGHGRYLGDDSLRPSTVIATMGGHVLARGDVDRHLRAVTRPRRDDATS